MERPKIEVRELNKRYAVKGRTLDVLHNVNFTAQESGVREPHRSKRLRQEHDLQHHGGA